MNAQDIIQQLQGHTILVLGDVMLDRYLHGAVSRISPEAPVPVVLHQGTEDRLGGAANVALNLKALGATPLLCSAIGDDRDGDLFRECVAQAGMMTEGLLSARDRITTVKTRVIGNKQQMLRIDSEDTAPLGDNDRQELVRKLENLLTRFPVKAIIFQDYNKGVLTPSLIEAAIGLAKERDIMTAVDPKKDNFFAFRGVDLFKPNLKEIRDSAPFPVAPEPDSLRKSAIFLQEKLQHRLTMITLSEKGLYLKETTEPDGEIFPTIPRNIADVSGAGDTVISIATLALVAGFPPKTLALLSNLAGGQVCEFPGVVPVDRNLLMLEIEDSLRLLMTP